MHIQENEELEFEKRLKEKRGFVIYRVCGDGNCLFRSIGTHQQQTQTQLQNK
jgi:hypothetical protein